MTVDVLVVIALRQVPELPFESLKARVVMPGLAIAVASPVTERLDLLANERRLDEDRAALSRGDVVRRVEAHRGRVSEAARALTIIS